MDCLILDERRVKRIEKIYNLLNSEETDIISDYETEYGQPDHWDKKTEESFNGLIDPVQKAKNQMYTLLSKLKKGELP